MPEMKPLIVSVPFTHTITVRPADEYWDQNKLQRVKVDRIEIAFAEDNACVFNLAESQFKDDPLACQLIKEKFDQLTKEQPSVYKYISDTDWYALKGKKVPSAVNVVDRARSTKDLLTQKE